MGKRVRHRTIHSNIARLRAKAGLSQRELADLCDVDETAVSHWENGVSSPRSKRLPVVAQALGVTIDDLYDSAGGAP
ncbi:MAG: helix-turn-helix domain-containing protein [Kofleriaceae bacterium]